MQHDNKKTLTKMFKGVADGATLNRLLPKGKTFGFCRKKGPAHKISNTEITGIVFDITHTHSSKNT